jgi:hypothetical protein
MTYSPGQAVRFVKGHLGIIDPRVSRYKFTDDEVEQGGTGIIVGGDDAPEAPDGWLIVEVEGGPRYVPVHPSMIEPVERFTDEDKAALRRDTDTLNAFARKVLGG